MGTIRINSTHPESQGEFVEVDDFNFDPSVHTPFSKEDEALARAMPQVKAWIAEQQQGGTGVGDEDATASPFAKLTVADLKAELDEQQIAYPANAKKVDLIALLDAAQKG